MQLDFTNGQRVHTKWERKIWTKLNIILLSLNDHNYMRFSQENMEHEFDNFIIHIIACTITWHIDSGLFKMTFVEDHAHN